MRDCSICLKRLPDTMFYRDASNNCGYSYRCKKCENKKRRKTQAESQRKYVKKHPHKQKARAILNNAVKRGLIKREPCVICKAENAEGHHDNYRKPLAVKWLCPQHHADHHYGRLS